MKKEKITKLQLNKETIACLDNMNEIRGGGPATDSCNTCGGTCGSDAACPTAVGPSCNGGSMCVCPPSMLICI